jgi:hypothetical protein
MSSLLRSEPKGLIPPPPAFKIGCYNTFNWRSYPSRKLAHRTCDALRWPKLHPGGLTIFPEHKPAM